ncbi:unnamed protein product, partial [Rotaria magnacalcarata]
PIQNCYKND